MPDLRLEIGPIALRDLDVIFDYSADAWGLDRALRYVDMLHEAIRRLRTFPNLGSDRSDISLGLRSIVAGEHIVFYRVLTGVIQITKVMHTREDASSHIDRDGI